MELTKKEIRGMIWRLLEAQKLARFPYPIQGRIPNFVGASKAAQYLRSIPEYTQAQVILVNPDSPQRPVRLATLQDRKILVMPTPRIRSGFLLIHSEKIPEHRYSDASTIRGAFKLGQRIPPSDLPVIDLKVMGCVAVTREGHRIGKGEGYSELESAILLEIGKLTQETPYLTTCHDMQIIDQQIADIEPWDLLVDMVITPTRILRILNRKKRPKILWKYLSQEKLNEIPLLKEMKRDHLNV
ncbi:MAG: 5-formyltetrahydrofolate cyclo-ligase [Candidatus Heimdallarchaeota archaeon]